MRVAFVLIALLAAPAAAAERAIELAGYLAHYDAATACSLSTVFATVGRCIMRSRHAV